MAFSVTKTLPFSQALLNYTCNNDYNIENDSEPSTIGGVLLDTQHVWQAKGPHLEVRNTKKGLKVGSWTFGCILRDSNTKIVDVKELQKSSGKLTLLAVALDCTVSGGIICLFNVFSSKVIRAIHVKEKISSLYIVDSGVEVLNLPGPLHDFDGILAVGTEGGNVFLIDLCRQICEESLISFTIRDELEPCQLTVLTPADVSKIYHYRERAVHKGNHLAIHLNAVLENETEHFTLKGPNGENRIHVNREEVCPSALYYCNQLTSLLVGFNFGAFQMWDLTNLKLVYTSPVCDEHIPITQFALQEPTDDPRAFCYVWVSFSNVYLYQTGLPFAVMYALCYESKEYHEGYGHLYQNFQYCAIRFQVELGSLEDIRSDKQAKGGICLGLQSVSKLSSSKDCNTHISTGETLALCVVSWTIWHAENKTQSNAFIFDLNQWYKEQMPTFSKWANCSNYILRMNLTELLAAHKPKTSPLLNVKMDENSLRQFIGVQRLEEHFYPTSLTFDLWLLKENEIYSVHSEGLQKALLHQIQTEGPLCLLRPTDIFHRLISLGLTPLFSDIPLSLRDTTDIQREIILNVALEHHLLNWLCKTASEWANGRFSSAGCSIEFLLKWAFQRAIVLKTNCDKLCAHLFDYSQLRLDNNTSVLLNSCTGQIKSLYKFYVYVIDNLSEFISYIDLADEQRNSLEMVATYFEVLQWLVNVGLLPECHPSAYPRPDNSERISAPYPVKQLIEYYNEKRANMQLLSKEQFASSDSLLFIDNLISHKCGAELLQKQWQDDGGSGLYPPPSLQSLLRTYLIPNASICHKHSLVIYLFLDLAMALDQRKYSPVITYLIKFPAVFKVTPSVIKITQAFWQLDHGDHSTAIEQLLDPFVLKEDLQPWHHTVAMRSLLVQNQHKAALRYMQVKRPPMTDETSILTAISLYIINNMVTEAFEFMKEHCQTNEDKFLMHLFNECNKNKSLHVLLYKCLNCSEEKAFLKYLENMRQPNSKDLQVFYFLLRSRFLEAFDAHSKTRRKDPDTQGLIGQRNATRADQIVRIFKNSLPDVNRNLVEYIRKEKNNLWKNVPRPTPLSVFVHDTQEQIKYKSTIIHAAISKAKNTFHETVEKSHINEVFTEETPFLRTPTAFRNSKRHHTPIITPKMIVLDEDGEELRPSPPKRLKLSPRLSTTSPGNRGNQSELIHSKMLTPMVKRKTSLEQRQTPENQGKLSVSNLQSILKVRQGSHFEESPLDEEDLNPAKTSSPLKSSYSILPRRSLSRSRQHVQFEEASRYSSSFSEPSSSRIQEDSTTFDEKLQQLSSKDASVTLSSVNSTNTSQEYYSPNASAEDKIEVKKIDEDKLVRDNNDLKKVCEVVNETKKEDEVARDDDTKLTQSPRARRSYKRSLGEMSPIRSSPRLSRNTPKLLAKSETSISQPELTKFTTKSKSEGELEDLNRTNITKSRLEENPQNDSPKPSSPLNSTTLTSQESSFIRSPRSPRLLQRVKGRKSLSRKVLEHNSFLRMQNSPFIQEKILTKTEKTTVIESSLTVEKTTDIESVINITDTLSSEQESPYSERQRLASSSISRRQSNRYSLGTNDTSADSSWSFKYDSESEPDELKASESLVEFVNNLENKNQQRTINDDNSIINESTNESQNIDDKVIPEGGAKSSALELTLPSESRDQMNTPTPVKEQTQTSLQFRKVQGRSSINKTNFTRTSALETSLSNVDEPVKVHSVRRSNLYSPETANTSTESACSFSYESDLTPEELKCSDSILEYVSSLNNKNKNENVADISKTTEENTPLETTTQQSVIVLDDIESFASDNVVIPTRQLTTLLPVQNSPKSNEKTETRPSSSASSEEAQISEEDEPPANFRRQVYEDLSSGTEDIEEVLTERKAEETVNDASNQLDVSSEPQEVILLDSTDESVEKDSTSLSEEDEENTLNQGAILEDEVERDVPTPVDDVVEIVSSDSEAEAEDAAKDVEAQHVEERQEVSLYSHLEESSSEGEDFSLVYRDMEDETQAATQALEAEMNEPTYNFEPVSDDVFETMEKEVAEIQPQPEKESEVQIEQQNAIKKSTGSQVGEKTFKESDASVEDTNHPLTKGEDQSDLVDKGETVDLVKKDEIKTDISRESTEEKDCLPLENTEEDKTHETVKCEVETSNVEMDINMEKEHLPLENNEEDKVERNKTGEVNTSKVVMDTDSEKEHLPLVNIGEDKTETSRTNEMDTVKGTNTEKDPVSLENIREDKTESSEKEVNRAVVEDENKKRNIAETSRTVSAQTETNVESKPKLQEEYVESGAQIGVQSENKSTKTESSTNTDRYDEDPINKKPSTRGKSKLKVDSCTNTTLLPKKKNSKTTHEINEVTKNTEDIKDTDRSLIVKIKNDESAKVLISNVEGTSNNVQKTNDDIGDSIVKKVSPEKTSKSKTAKHFSTDETNTSSSDTTEGEIGRQDIVVTAQVHSPSRKKVVEPLFKRITRRRSQLLSQDDSVESLPGIDANISLDGTTSKEDVTLDLKAAGLEHLRGTKTRKTLSTSSKQRTTIATRRSSHSEVSANIDIDCKPSTSKQTLEDKFAKKLLRRTRSASVDDTKTYSRYHNLRSTSTFSENETIQEEVTPKPAPRTNAVSESGAPLDSKETEETNAATRKRSRAGSILKSYTVSRRLTRNQADIIKSMPTVSVEEDGEVEEQVGVDDFNPIKLLDKEPFEGEPDPEEKKVYEQSSPSTSSVSSATKPRKITRSASMTSDTGAEEVSPKKRRSVTRSEAGTPVKPVRRRSRRQSNASSIASETSEQNSPPKRTRRKNDDSEEVASNVSASSRTLRRSRTSSVNSDDSTTSASKKTGRKRILSAQQELPKIAEEKVNESVTSEESSGSRTIKTRSKNNLV